MSRISVSSSRIARSVSSRWACSASTCSRASSYSRSASGLTGPIWARRRSRRSSRRSISARSSSLIACSAAGTSSPSRSAIAASSRSASARRSPRWAASTSALVSSSATASSPPAARTPAASRPAARRRSRRRRPRHRPPCPRCARPGPGSRCRPLDRGERGADVVEQRLATGDPRARLAVALAEQALGPAGVADARSDRCGRRRAPLAGGLGGAVARATARPLSGRGARRRPSQLLHEFAGALAGALPRPTSRVSGPSSERSDSSFASSSVSRLARLLARTAIFSCSPRSLVSRPQAWVRSRSRAAKRSSASRRRLPTAASRSSIPARVSRAAAAAFSAAAARSAPKRSSSETIWPAGRAPRARSARRARPPAPGASAAAGGLAPRARRRAHGRGCRGRRAASARPGAGVCGACRGRPPPRPGAGACAASSG